MNNNLNKYNQKRDFSKTKEPRGETKKGSKKLAFVLQHHLARNDHYDFRLEWQGVLKSWAIPKGPSYNLKDKRLAVLVEDHPISYKNFEGIIPEGQYGGGTVMITDKGTFEYLGDAKKDFQNGSLKIILHGSILKGQWALVRMKDNNWLLIKEKDEYVNYLDINDCFTSIKTGRTMAEIKNKQKINPNRIENTIITNPNKKMYTNPNITKKEVALYYQKVENRMLPYLQNRIISTIRCPDGINGSSFYKKHLEAHNGLGTVNLSNANENNKKEVYYYIKNINGLINEAQMNTIEFHTWGSKVETLEHPDIMVFDLDPDEKMDISKVRQGVTDLKTILDELNLKAFLKTSGNKGYHVIVPIEQNLNWSECRDLSKKIAEIMEAKWPNKYTTNMRKEKRKNKIFIDWIRNTRGASSVAPYSLRAKKGAPVSMPIKWSELEKVTPNSIKINDALKRLKHKDPWAELIMLSKNKNK